MSKVAHAHALHTWRDWLHENRSLFALLLCPSHYCLVVSLMVAARACGQFESWRILIPRRLVAKFYFLVAESLLWPGYGETELWCNIRFQGVKIKYQYHMLKKTSMGKSPVIEQLWSVRPCLGALQGPARTWQHLKKVQTWFNYSFLPNQGAQIDLSRRGWNTNVHREMRFNLCRFC